jgi:mannan endo-1,6-alpha-mannosidase
MKTVSSPRLARRTNTTIGSIKDAAASVAKNLISYYDGNKPGKTPGILPGPPPAGDYYWGEAGAMWNTLISYWHATGDSSYNDLITQGLLWQVSPGNNFMPPNVTAQMGNDDQGMWGMAAMTAAETNFTNSSNKSDTQWLQLAENVFENLASPSRWDSDSCGGGLRWQIPLSNNGYDYKNSISTGVLFNLASRLAHLTGNTTYADWADKAWTWMESVGFLANGTIYDGAHVEQNCTDINKSQFSYNLGVFIEGAAHMFNSTAGGDVWRDRLSTLVGGASHFTDDKCVPVETVCESSGSCITDMLAFKSIFLHGLAVTAELAPYTKDKLDCVFKAAVNAAAASCDDAGDKGAQCGFVWTSSKDDNSYGAGQQMNALTALSVEYQLQAGPAGKGNGTSSSGSSSGGSNSGGSGNGSPTQSGATPTTSKSEAGMTADRVPARFLVASALLAVGFTALLA